MSPYIQFKPVLDRTDLPNEPKRWLDAWVQSSDVISGNQAFFTIDIADYRSYVRESSAIEYAEDYGPYLAKFMEWLDTQTSVDEVLVLYWG